MSSLFCLLGVLMIALPRLSISFIGIAAGVMLIAFGIVKLIGYFSRDLYRLAFQYDLAFGILLLVLGVLLLINPGSAVNFLCLILGISIMADGLFKLQTAFDAKRFGLPAWWLILVLGVFASAVGVIATFHPAQSARILTILLGVSMLAEGALNLSVAIFAVKIIRNQQPDYME